MNNKMSRTVRDKAEQIARRWLRKRDNDIAKKRDFWLGISIIQTIIISILIPLIFLL